MKLKERIVHNLGQSIGLIISTKMLIQVTLFIVSGMAVIGLNHVADKFRSKK